MTCCSNHSSGCSVARSLTAVGLTRASIGPAMSTMLLGLAWSPCSDITAVAASTGPHGWQIAITCAPGPTRPEEPDHVLGVLVEPEAAVGERDVACVVPVGQVHVVVAQHRAHRLAHERGEVTRERRHEQHPGPGAGVSLAKCRSVQNGVDVDGPLLDLDRATAAAHRCDPERRPLVGELGPGEHLGARGQHPDARAGRRHAGGEARRALAPRPQRAHAPAS